MSYSLDDTKQILSRTPEILKVLLTGLNESLLSSRKRDDSYTPSDVVGHLLANEEVNFIRRMKVILAGGTEEEFGGNPAQLYEGFDQNSTLEQRLALFESVRKESLDFLDKSVTESDLTKTVSSQFFGEITLSQFLSYWVVHDLTHIFQVEETLALRFKDTVGPWHPFLKILNLDDKIRNGMTVDPNS